MDLRATVRHEIVTSWAIFLAKQIGNEQHFLASHNWEGYREAFASWEKAVWQWADAGLTVEIENFWRSSLNNERGRFASTENHTKPANDFELERYLQIYLLHRADFLAGLRHKNESVPGWFKEFGFYFYIAKTLDDDDIFKELARLTTRKTSQAHIGKRSLPIWILRLGIPGCFWAFTNDGMIDRLRSLSELVYSEGSIRNTISKLNLWRPKKPLYWGVNSKGELVDL